MGRLDSTFVFMLSLCSIVNCFQRDPTPYRDSDCPEGTPVGLGVNNGRRVPDSAFTASSSHTNRDPAKGRLDEQAGAWTAKVQDASQWLAVDLGREYVITKLQTQGRQGSGEYVSEYMFAFSNDAITWRYYTNEFGIREMFVGNTNSQDTVTRVLKYPIMGRYVRFHPQRWVEIISLRVEIYGCPYTPEVARFSGNGYIHYDLSTLNPPPSTTSDQIKLRFKTSNQNGVLLYADGNQGDFIALQLHRGNLLFSIDLGSTQLQRGLTQQTGGSLLDDSQWHDIIIRRNHTKITLVVDRLETHFETNGLFYRLNLDKKIYLGGLLTFNMNGITVKYNFDGCLDNVVFNGIRMIRDTKNGFKGFSMVGAMPDPWNCKMIAPMPATFFSLDSYILTTSDAGGNAFRVRFDFRTHDEDGILLYHEFQTGGFFRASLDKDGYVNYELQDANGQKIEDKVRNTALEYTSSFSDGLWHAFSVVANQEMLNVTVDLNSKVSSRKLTLASGTDYYIGGYTIGISFRGCIRNIVRDYKPLDLKGTDFTSKDIQVGTCGLIDRCTPNPCENGGVCDQDWNTFTCDCGTSGYEGAVCHRSSYYLSCDMHKMYTSDENEEKTYLDPDGSGPLKPFQVLCSGKVELGKEVVTKIGHNSEDLITVNGYQAPNFYVRQIEYDADLPELTALIERAATCTQGLSYKCRNSRLLISPGSEAPEYPHWGWWVGRTYQPMYYWGGAAPGSGKCECGLTEVGCAGGQKLCNCDSQLNETDEGQIQHKDYLPILELHFGDTGTAVDNKIGYHKVDKLECRGDNLLDNVITFRKADASIHLSTFEAEPSGDIWFQFKTTAFDGIMVHQSGKPDFIKIAIANGNTVQFSYDVGNGAQVIEYRSTNALNDDQWHTVHVEKNRKEAWLRVDNFPAQTSQEGIGEKTRTLDLTGYLFIGASVEDRNGYVGCMRGLRINGVLQDLRGLVHREEVTYGVSEGCVGKCANQMCFNGGTCIEGYSGYTCDCAYTPFRGWNCGREVGVNMLKEYMIQYEFSNQQGLSATDFMHVRVGFTTKKKQGILLQLQDAKNEEYISLEVNNAGGIKFALDVGSERFEVNTPNHGIDYTNGQQHEVRMWRTGENGNLVHIQVDNYPEEALSYGTKFSDNILDDPKYLFVGNNSTQSTTRGFEGCIFRMEIDNVYPLKRAFQDPKPDFVTLYPEGKLREDMCGYEETTVLPDPIESRPINQGDLVDITYPTPPDPVIEKKIIGGVVGAICFLILIVIVGLLFYCRDKGDYETKEAKGADIAENADVAVVFNQTGVPDITKRQEFFM
ncbi:neurexin-4-like [Saccostrea cucullata]|uniref:neurexin-4-like n=1 Tax=Saccostrea cuccullata TaxID=36930 RepID=UPI002ED35AB1